jgi:hypothetical protein
MQCEEVPTYITWEVADNCEVVISHVILSSADSNKLQVSIEDDNLSPKTTYYYVGCSDQHTHDIHDVTNDLYACHCDASYSILASNSDLNDDKLSKMTSCSGAEFCGYHNFIDNHCGDQAGVDNTNLTPILKRIDYDFSTHNIIQFDITLETADGSYFSINSVVRPNGINGAVFGGAFASNNFIMVPNGNDKIIGYSPTPATRSVSGEGTLLYIDLSIEFGTHICIADTMLKDDNEDDYSADISYMNSETNEILNECESFTIPKITISQNPAQICSAGWVEDCSVPSTCCLAERINDLIPDCAPAGVGNINGCDLSCYPGEISFGETSCPSPTDSSSDSTTTDPSAIALPDDICNSCIRSDYTDLSSSSTDSPQLSECCDAAFVLFGVNCAYLERIGYDCLGCLCPGDLGQEDGSCPEGTINNCNEESDLKCCQGDWVGDGVCDDPTRNERGRFGNHNDICDLTCHEAELTEDCGQIKEIYYDTKSKITGFQFHIEGEINVGLIRGGISSEVGFHMNVNLDVENPIVIGYAFDLTTVIQPGNGILTNIYYSPKDSMNGGSTPPAAPENCSSLQFLLKDVTLVSEFATGLIAGVSYEQEDNEIDDGNCKIIIKEGCTKDENDICYTPPVIITTKTDPYYYNHHGENGEYTLNTHNSSDDEASSSISHYQTVIYYDSSISITGFEFKLGIKVTSITNMDASIFSIASSEDQVIAFSWSALELPPSDGVLLILNHSIAQYNTAIQLNQLPIIEAIFVGSINVDNFDAPAYVPLIIIYGYRITNFTTIKCSTNFGKLKCNTIFFTCYYNTKWLNN